MLCVNVLCYFVPEGGGGGTPYDGQRAMLWGLDPHFRAWLDRLDTIPSTFASVARSLGVHIRAWLDPLDPNFNWSRSIF